MSSPCNGLVLTGGGARAAYQAGVLQAIAELNPDPARNPFPVITGTSAGCINAAVIASHAQHFNEGVDELAALWRYIEVRKVFRTDTLAVLGNALRWVWAILRGNLGSGNVHAVLDNTPLRHLLERHLIMARVQQALDYGSLRALGIVASGYSSARSVTFYEAIPEVEEWTRPRRFGQPGQIRIDHLMASTAIPLIFPAIRIGAEYFGDGSMRLTAPLSPAIHLGADRLLVIGVRDEIPDRSPTSGTPRYPSFGQIMGYILDTLFMDSLYNDVERVNRINSLLDHDRRAANGEHLRPVDVTLMLPSKDLREIARRHVKQLPRSVKLLLRGMGGLRANSRQLISYLLFDSGFCRELLELGYQDAMAQKDRLMPFFED